MNSLLRNSVTSECISQTNRTMVCTLVQMKSPKWLKSTHWSRGLKKNVCVVDFWNDDMKRVMDVEFDSLANCEDFGIQKDGIALLIAFCFAFAQNLPTRTIHDL